jgi:hypothetical protein
MPKQLFLFVTNGVNKIVVNGKFFQFKTSLFANILLGWKILGGQTLIWV